MRNFWKKVTLDWDWSQAPGNPHALPADPGGPRGPAPIAPRFFQNHAVFRLFLGKTQYFEQIVGSAPVGVKTLLAPLTKILDPSLSSGMVVSSRILHPRLGPIATLRGKATNGMNTCCVRRLVLIRGFDVVSGAQTHLGRTQSLRFAILRVIITLVVYDTQYVISIRDSLLIFRRTDTSCCDAKLSVIGEKKATRHEWQKAGRHINTQGMLLQCVARCDKKNLLETGLLRDYTTHCMKFRNKWPKARMWVTLY